MKRFIVMGVVLQLAMVVAGHFVDAVLMLSGILGTVIPLVLGLWYGSAEPVDYKEASKGGFLIGITGAFIGVLAAIFMGDQPWMLLSFAPVSSGVTGVIGSVIGRAMPGGKGRP